MTSVALPAATTEAGATVGVRWSATALTAIVAVFLVVGWIGIRGLDPVLGWDGDAFIHDGWACLLAASFTVHSSPRSAGSEVEAPGRETWLQRLDRCLRRRGEGRAALLAVAVVV